VAKRRGAPRATKGGKPVTANGRKPVEFTIVTGMSGAGKTQALKCLEDRGFFCVDNLPPALIPTFADLILDAPRRIERVALVSDVRGGEFFDQLFEALEELKGRGIRCRILFLEASDEVLVRRFKESRRPHPLQKDGKSLEEAIREERERLRELRERADKVIDTSQLTIHDLRKTIEREFLATEPNGMAVSIVSFGFKYGIPPDADLVFDVRFLKNPNYEPELKPLDGRSKEVREYVLSDPTSREFLRRLFGLIEFALPHYAKEGKPYLSIAIGCTGGRHRSVAIAEELAGFLQRRGYRVSIHHRDIEKG